jgi:hypothetical protein
MSLNLKGEDEENPDLIVESLKDLIQDDCKPFVSR